MASPKVIVEQGRRVGEKEVKRDGEKVRSSRLAGFLGEVKNGVSLTRKSEESAAACSISLRSLTGMMTEKCPFGESILAAQVKSV